MQHASTNKCDVARPGADSMCKMSMAAYVKVCAAGLVSVLVAFACDARSEGQKTTDIGTLTVSGIGLPANLTSLQGSHATWDVSESAMSGAPEVIFTAVAQGGDVTLGFSIAEVNLADQMKSLQLSRSVNVVTLQTSEGLYQSASGSFAFDRSPDVPGSVDAEFSVTLEPEGTSGAPLEILGTLQGPLNLRCQYLASEAAAESGSSSSEASWALDDALSSEFCAYIADQL